MCTCTQVPALQRKLILLKNKHRNSKIYTIRRNILEVFLNLIVQASHENWKVGIGTFS